MRFVGVRPLPVLLITLLLNFFIIQSAVALTVTSVRFGAHPDSQRLVIELDTTSDFRAFTLTEPNRLVIDLPTFAWRVGTIQKPVSFPVRDIRFGPLGSGISRIVIEAGEPLQIQAAFLLPRQKNQADRLVIDFKRTSAAVMAATMSQVHGSLQTQTLDSVQSPKTALVKSDQLDSSPSSPKKKGGTKPVIIIDPGHGGQDPGARGANGAYEKNIVLAVGLELKRQLEESGRYHVLMTRSTDVFIPLAGRVKFARRNKGDLFISLHADSIRDKGVTGASVYTLSEKASDEATARLAERENKSDMIAGIDLSIQDRDVANILLDLATRDTMNQSKFLANTVVSGMDRNGIVTLERPHRSAGFAVLKAPDIPSILVEMGYLTNRQEVARLSSPDYRRKIASALKLSVDGYFQKVARDH